MKSNLRVQSFLLSKARDVANADSVISAYNVIADAVEAAEAAKPDLSADEQIELYRGLAEIEFGLIRTAGDMQYAMQTALKDMGVMQEAYDRANVILTEKYAEHREANAQSEDREDCELCPLNEVCPLDDAIAYRAERDNGKSEKSPMLVIATPGSKIVQ